MARVLRFNKKQPAFDPSELQDLIFSPAVGTGVGSHLLHAINDFPTPKIEDIKNQDLSTVDSKQQTTVDKTNCSTVGLLSQKNHVDLRSSGNIINDLQPFEHIATANNLNPSTVDQIHQTTVDIMSTIGTSDCEPNMTTVDRLSIPIAAVLANSAVAQVGAATPEEEAYRLKSFIDESLYRGREGDNLKPGTAKSPDLPTVDTTNPSTVDQSDIPSPAQRNHANLWITEQGELVAQGRVKKIRLAQDVINSAEESVYDTLWTMKTLRTDEREPFRIVQAGYDYLVKRTRLSKKTIQRIVARLIDKNFIAIERPADIYERSSTVYRVFSYKTVLERHIQRGRSHVAKMGPGFVYVRRINDPRPHLSEQTPEPPSLGHVSTNLNVTTVATSNRARVVSIPPTTLANKLPTTVPKSNLSTVVRQTTTLVEKNVLESNTLASASIHQALSQYGPVDDDIVRMLITSCLQYATDCTEQEIVHFISQKGSLIRSRENKIYNPIGFLLTAVPKCLSGDTLHFYREEQMRQSEAEGARQAELAEWRKEQEAHLADPNISEELKNHIRRWLETPSVV